MGCNKSRKKTNEDKYLSERSIEKITENRIRKHEKKN